MSATRRWRSHGELKSATLDGELKTVKEDLKKERHYILSEHCQLTNNDVLLKHYQRHRRNQRESSFEEVNEEEKNVLLKYHRQKLAKEVNTLG